MRRTALVQEGTFFAIVNGFNFDETANEVTVFNLFVAATED